MDTEIAQSPLATLKFWNEGLDRTFFARVYTRSTQVGAVLALILLANDQKAIATGILSGLAVALFSTWTVEATVRLLFRGGSNAGLKLAIGAILKLPVLLGGLLGISWGAYNGYLNVFAVVGGVVLLHAVMITLIIVQAMTALDRNTIATR